MRRSMLEDFRERRGMRFTGFAAVLLLLIFAEGHAQQLPNPYGLPVSLENARKAANAAIGEARKNNWTMAIAIVDPNGTLIYYEKMDNTQNGSADVAIDKARSAALFKRPTKAFEDLIAGGGDGLRYLRMRAVIPIEGGIPIVTDGKIVGGVGVSGGKSGQDVGCAQIAVDALK
jgi:glc operon protein GlcG